MGLKLRNTRLLTSLTILLSLLLIYSCKKTVSRDINPEFARYIAAFTYGNISSNSSIQIELTQDMPAVELNKEIDAELFEFSPSIKGKAYWTGTRNIKFIPDPGELKSGVEYQAVFKLDKVMNVEKEFKEFSFFFKVPSQNFSVDVSPYSPTKDNDLIWNSVQGTLKLADEAPIDKIAKMFSVSGTPNPVKINVVPTETKGLYSFTIDSLKRTDKASEYKLNVSGSAIESKRDTTVLINIPALSMNNFYVIDVQSTFDPQECIRITFSDPLSQNQNIQGLVSPNGVKNFSYDVKKNVLKLFLDTKNESNSKVSLKIFKELKSADGKSLDKDYTYELTLQRNKPEVKMLNGGNILPNSSNLVIPFQAVNLWAVDVKVVKIYENNIMGYLQSNNFGGDNELRRFGRLILKKRIRLDKDPSMRLDQWNTFNLDLATMIKQDPGAIYRIQFSIKKEYSLYPCKGVIPKIPDDASLEKFDEITEEDEREWDIPRSYYYDSYDYDEYEEYNWDDSENPCESSYYVYKKTDCIVFASNIGVIAKKGEDKKILVGATNILTTEPLSGATVDVYNYQMQRIGSGKTGGDGFATIEYKGGVPFAIIVSKDKEKGYLKVTSNLALSLSNFDIDGRDIQKGLKGYIYGERGVWRPGDSIFLTFVLEDKEKTLPKNHPVTLDMYSPTGQLYKKLVQNSSVDGFYSFKLSTDPNAPTGNWSTIIKVGGATFRKTLKIETIKPNRLKVRLNMGELIDASKGTFPMSLSSQWLHGAAASNLKSNVEMTLRTVYNPFKGYESYTFNNPANKFKTDTYTIYDGRLDSEGNAAFMAKLPQAASAPGMLQANIISRVFESGGDASFYTQTAAYSPYSSYVGVKTPAEYDYTMLETDKNNPVDIVTLSPEGKPVDISDVNVKIYKIDWSWWWSNDSRDLSSYVNNTSTQVVLNENVSTNNGKARVDFMIKYPDYGRYLIVVKNPQSGHITGKIIYVDWPSWRGRSDKKDPSGLTMLAFSTDKKTYNAGEKATVIIPKSSQGNVLISIENGTKVIQKGWVKTSEKEDTKYTFTVTEEMTPNFYIFATLLQPHEQTVNGLPIRMYGVLNINVENKNTVLRPVIKMPDELRPEKEFTVSVSEMGRKKMTYTLAVVDEGLLDLTSFKTPNAWNDFYSRQSLGVRTWDMFDMVVGASAGKLGPLLSIGGDEELKPGNSQFNRFKPVVEFLGPFTAKAGETKTHKIKLPNYIGSVRVMVVAGNDEGAYGNAEKTVPVNNPLMVLSTLPRVTGPDEDILFPVNVFVTKDNIKNVTVNIQSTNGLLQPVDGTSKSVTFTGKGDQIVYFKLKAAKATGYEKISVKATGGGEASSEVIDIEVRNPNPPILLSSSALVAGGTSQTLQLAMDAPQPTDWVKLEISRMPAVNLSQNISYLMRYPHGCTEQLTSKAFPLLYVENFAQLMDVEKQRAKDNINDVIQQVSARQLSDGGFIYWPGNPYPTEWVTTYTGHFLLEAQKAGYNVPESVITKWKNFQKKASQNWNRRDLYTSYYTYSMADLQQAYRLYALALAGEPELGAMNRLKEMKDLSVQARWRLAAAYVIAGKKDAANQLTQTTDVINPYSRSNNTYGNADRDRAMIMETYLLLGRTDKALALATKVSESLSSNYISTQTAAFGLIAMSKLAKEMGSGAIVYEWELNGVKQKNVNSAPVFEEITIKPQENININFTNKGEGQLFVRLVGYTQPLVDKYPATTTGGMNIYVKYLDMNGKEMDVTSLKQGTEFYASVIVQNVSGEFLTDIALNQIFASGWEIFNERLFNSGSGNSSSYNYQDIRDDRVYTYFNLSNGYSSSFRVRLQAAYCGRFYLPAVACEAMYSPEEQARTQGKWVEVIQSGD